MYFCKLRIIIKFKLKNNLIVYAKPKDINYYITHNKPKTHNFRRTLHKFKFSKFLFFPVKIFFELFDFFEIEDSYFSEEYVQYFKDTKIYNRVYDILKVPITHSNFYKHLMNKLMKNGISKHKKYELKSEDAIHDFIKSYSKYLSNEKNLLRVEKKEYGSCLIDKDGNILKSLYVRHRFFAAKILIPNKPFPLIVDGISKTYIKNNYDYNLNFSENIRLMINNIQDKLNP